MIFGDLDYELDKAEMFLLVFLTYISIHNNILRAKENTIRCGLYWLFMKELKTWGERAYFAIS